MHRTTLASHLQGLVLDLIPNILDHHIEIDETSWLVQDRIILTNGCLSTGDLGPYAFCNIPRRTTPDLNSVFTISISECIDINVTSTNSFSWSKCTLFTGNATQGGATDLAAVISIVPNITEIWAFAALVVEDSGVAKVVRGPIFNFATGCWWEPAAAASVYSRKDARKKSCHSQGNIEDFHVAGLV